MVMRIRPGQVLGSDRETSLKEELLSIIDKAKTYDAPVPTKNDLPMDGNDDGDVRLVLNENMLYVWDEPTNKWVPMPDKRTERRTTVISIDIDNQINFTTDIPVGIEGGIIDIEAINIYVNGMKQSERLDYELGVTGQQPPRLILTWKSTDFQLDPTDTMSVVYDILLID